LIEKDDAFRKNWSRHPRLAEGPGWQLVHLPTHPVHFYDVHRYEFTTSVQGETNGSCHIMSVVEGESVILETANGKRNDSTTPRPLLCRRLPVATP
jgi:hypothetical protein